MNDRMARLHQLRTRVEMELLAEARLRGIPVSEDDQVLVDINVVDPAAIRAWANDRGYHVEARGKVPFIVQEAYQLAHKPGVGSRCEPVEPAPSLLLGDMFPPGEVPA